MSTDSERIAELEADLARLRRLISGPPQIEDIRVENDRLRMEIGDHWGTLLLAQSFADSLDGAVNCIELRLTGSAGPITATLRREHGKSPMQLLDEYKRGYHKLLLRLLNAANQCVRAGKTPWDVDLDAFLAEHAPAEAPPPARAAPEIWAAITSEGCKCFRCGTVTPMPSPASASVISAVALAFGEEHKDCQEGDEAILRGKP